jgi:hypothetical protein
MSRIVLILITLTIFASCGPTEDGRGLEPALDRVATTRYLVFEGEIPCIDCDQIDVKLWLEKDSVAETSDYKIRTIHRNTAQGDIHNEMSGVYARLRGHQTDPQASIFQLNPGTDNPRYFLLKEDGRLRVLGPNLERLVEDEGDLDYDLESVGEEDDEKLPRFF